MKKYENYKMTKFLKTEAQLSTMKTEKKYDNMRTKKYENYRMRKLLNPPPKLVYLSKIPLAIYYKTTRRHKNHH